MNQMETQPIIETIQNIFIGADRHDWDRCRSAFAPVVYLDYTSLAGGEPVSLAVDVLINNWKSFLPRFKSTHHLLGNFDIREKKDTAEAFFYGTATHYSPQPDGRNIWTVIATYEAGLEKHSGEWKVTALKLNLSCVDGNLELPALVMK
jgi:hypothetical protein